MIKLTELGGYVGRVISDLELIAEKMGRYTKIDTDLRARALINEINGKIKQINLAFETYNRKDMYESFKDFDFENYVKTIQKYVIDCQKTYENIKRFEKITDYY